MTCVTGERWLECDIVALVSLNQQGDLFVTGERLLECDTVALVSLNQQGELFVTGDRWLECDIYSFGLAPSTN